MYYHIILTERCNSQCKYCYEKSIHEFDNGLDKKFQFDYEVPCDSIVSGEKIAGFLEKGDTLIFYGGEPLVNFNKMKEIIDDIEKSNKKIKFCMQTNGKLLHEVPPEYIKKLSKILVSIDGFPDRTDYNRGKGNYEVVLKNIIWIREKGFNGEIVARMALDFPDVFEQVEHIIGLIEKKIFDSVHWQIDAGFYKFDFNEKEFRKFVKDYNNSIDKLLDFWIEYMKEKKKVLKLYPFLGIFDALYNKKKMKLQCGSGYANYTISTDGKIVTCPITNGIKDFYCGDLDTPKENLKQIYVKEPCTLCEYLEICGGRCLYSNHAKLWPPEGEKLICNTIIHFIEGIKKKIPEIKELINQKVIKKKDFEFERYFGPEIIP
jgi:putative peptide-modifying radical SAM enzyme